MKCAGTPNSSSQDRLKLGGHHGSVSAQLKSFRDQERHPVSRLEAPGLLRPDSRRVGH
jgi:hypothetical protein